MNKQETTKSALELAQEYYYNAQEEHNRPEEDIMPYRVCRSAYKSVGNYLAAFLNGKGVEVKDEMTLEYLLNACRGLEPAFNELDLEMLFYGNEHDLEAIWADENTMHAYLNLVERTKNLYDKVGA